VAEELLVPITSDVDVVSARQKGRELAAEAGFSSGDQTVIAAAISEIARNILMYAKRGEIALRTVMNGDLDGVIIVARDQGPGFPTSPARCRTGTRHRGAGSGAAGGAALDGRLRRRVHPGKGPP